MNKKIKSINEFKFQENTDGFQTIDMFHNQFEIEPFLVFTEFHMSKPIFGPHPHAGISVMTYMHPNSQGSFLNKDSLGDKSIIEPGGVHVTVAGRGVKHEEFPTKTGEDCHGFQIWINHSDKNRLMEPKSFHSFSKEVTEYKDDKILVRIILGEFQNLNSHFQLPTNITLLDIHLEPNSSYEFDSMEMGFVYLLSGELVLGEEEKLVTNHTLVNFVKEGNKISVKSKNEKSNFIFASGVPHNEPVVSSGPFVMTTNEQMLDTKRRLSRGEMGFL